MKHTLDKLKVTAIIKEYIEGCSHSNQCVVKKSCVSKDKVHDTPLIIRNGNEVLAVIEYREGIVGEDVKKAQEDIAYISQLLHAPISILWLPFEFYFYQENTKEWVHNSIKSSIDDSIDILYKYIIGQQMISKTILWENVQKEWILGLEDLDFDTKDLLANLIRNFNPHLIIENNYFYLPEKDENDFFKTLIGYYVGDKLCRFTSLRALFCTINYKKQRMNGIVSMNDKTEVDYVKTYICKKDKTLGSLFSKDNFNDYYILSCCAGNRENDFTMLRLYADDAKGACVKYTIQNDYKSQNFYIGPISYANSKGENSKLDYICNILKKKIQGKSVRFRNLGIWQRFFKPYEYKDEKEIRLLFYNIEQDEGIVKPIIKPDWDLNETYGIVFPHVEFNIEKAKNEFPLVISSITLGPKTPEAEMNAKQLNFLLENNIKVIKPKNKEIVRTSPINHYR